MTISHKTKNKEETQKLGEELSKSLRAGSIIALVGDLGAGKTHLTKGIVKGLGLKATVKSPTYVLLNIYKGNLPVYHYDCYRLKGPEDMERIGYEEYFYGEGVTVVEWADRIAQIIPKEAIKVTFKILAGDLRAIEISGLQEA